MNLILTTCIMIAAATNDAGDGIVATGTITIGASVVSAILTYLATKKHGEKVAESVQDAVPQPLSIEQTAYQAAMKENSKGHENLFARVSRLEQAQAALAARFDATINSINEQLHETKDMVRQLFEFVCKNGRRMK